MSEPSYVNSDLDTNATAGTMSPLYYTNSQMAQMLVPPPDPLSTDSGTTNLQQLFPQLYAQQMNQQDQAGVAAPPAQAAPQGYRRGGMASLHVNADMPHFAYLAKGGFPPMPPVVNNDQAVDAMMHDKSLLSRYGVDMASVPPDRKPPVPSSVIPPSPRINDGPVQGRAKGGMIEPSEAQKHAGNYKKTHGHVWGIPISIENPAGSIRSGKGKDGKEWSVRMPHHYGYFKRTEGKDGDQVDVHVGPHIETDQVHVIDQVNPDTGKFDEHKVMMGFHKPHEAVNAYHSSFSDGKGHLRMGGMVSMHMHDFRKWLKDKSATKRPAGPGIHKPAKSTGGILQHFAAGGPVMPRLKQYPSTTVPVANYVPPMPHYRDNLGNSDMSAFRNSLQDMVR